ncbi:methyl-accepting chemotaxis protein [Alicyclobacillus acidoterrestris]|uniref:Methyl-accepting chemotaxis protein n=1 Tax=Alicyclobacillus acidoterrestris (strain ATCC 49025 / DSM 3922 / CIP 106132 / NCIMB 13137 / GD3B) TaxID=1356854 RepID=A0A9E7CR34_ALIAG|nr:methyl-accepting chemotaxis protein [Alicyclobacillus acidoterrestris]UNO49104.1 methyl-accepting chemotaxis protein [Alicyclobacillus acidoterrestris]
MGFVKHLKIGTKVNALVVSIILAIAIVVSLVAKFQITDGMDSVFENRLHSDIAMSYDYLNQKYPGDWRIQDGQLYKGSQKISGGDNTVVDKVGKDTGDAVTIFQGDTRVSTNVMENGRRAIGTTAATNVADTVLKHGQAYAGIANIEGQKYLTNYDPIRNTNGQVIGMWFVGTPVASINHIVTTVLTVILIALGIVTVLSIVAVLWFTNGLKKRLQGIGRALGEAGTGNFTVTLADNSNDEIGQLTQNYNQMKSSLHQLFQNVSQASHQVAASAEELTASAEQSSKAAEQVAVAVQNVAAGSEQQAQSADETAHTLNRIAASVQQMSASAEEVAASSEKASDLANKGNNDVQIAVAHINAIGSTMDNLVQKVNVLSAHSQEIEKITNVITDIASQTNLLALNAAIEAARAGEHGQGFAVVALEVRKLAEKSGTSADEIKQVIGKIQSEIENVTVNVFEGTQTVTTGIESVEGAGKSFADIYAAVNTVRDQIREVAAGVKEMATNTEQIVRSVDIIASAAENASAETQNASAATEEQLATMEEIAAALNHLAEMAETLQAYIGRFNI